MQIRRAVVYINTDYGETRKFIVEEYESSETKLYYYIFCYHNQGVMGR